MAAGEPCSGGTGQKASAGEATAGIDRVQEAIRSNTQRRVTAASTHLFPLAVDSRNESTASAWMRMAEIHLQEMIRILSQVPRAIMRWDLSLTLTR